MKRTHTKSPELDKVAVGADMASLSVALQTVLMWANVECRAK
jgi:hypothetical protein